MPPEILIGIPTYGHFDYARRAVISAFNCTASPIRVLIVDDASPDWDQSSWEEFNLDTHHFESNGGLTRSWNYICHEAKRQGIRYTVCTNSDIIFTDEWDKGLIAALDNGFKLVGPITNAPGIANRDKQDVKHYFPNYSVTDDQDYLSNVANDLYRRHKDCIIPYWINGFFMMAETEVWWDGAFDENNVFDPSKIMQGNEDELQYRWRRNKWLTGVVPSSFIFHYRSITRGDKYRCPGWYVMANESEYTPQIELPSQLVDLKSPASDA